MITSKELHKITGAFKKAYIAKPVFDRSYIFDENGATIGLLDWTDNQLYLHTNYIHFELAKQSLKQNNIPFKEKPIDLAELVYGQPE